jgi:hypothetical protein
MVFVAAGVLGFTLVDDLPRPTRWPTAPSPST